MARKHADIRTSIWTDEDWRSLSMPAQWLYLALISQPDLNQLGVLALRPARWATLTDTKRGAIDKALSELEARRFVVTDANAGELLVRTFVRNDEVWRKPNLMLSAESQLPEVTSSRLLLALRVELADLRQPAAELPRGKDGKDGPTVRSVDVIDRILERLPEPFGGGFPEGLTGPIPEPTGEPLGEPPTRAGRRGPTAPLLPSPQLPAVPPPAARTLDAGVDPPDTAQTLIAEWIDHCPKRPPERVIGQTSKEIRAMLAEGVDAGDLRNGLAAWHSKGLHPSSLPSAVNEVMNAPSRASPNGAARPSTTDSRVAAGVALANRLQAEEIP